MISLALSCSLYGELCNPAKDVKCAYLRAWFLKDVNLDSAKYYANLSLSLISKSTSAEDISKALTVNGIILQYEYKFEESLEQLIKALNYKLEIGDSLEIAKGYNNVGTTLMLAEQFELAAKYFRSSMSYTSPEKDSSGYVSKCSNLGLVYKSMGNSDSALICFRKGELYISETNQSQAVSDLYFNIGKLFRDLLNYNLSISYFQKAIVIQRLNFDDLGMAMSYLNLGISYQLSSDFKKANSCYFKADSIGSQIDDLQLKADIKKVYFLLPFYETSNQVQIDRFNDWLDIETELTQIRINSNGAEVEAKYQTKLKDEQLALLKERSERAEAISKRNFWLALTGGGLAISLAAVGHFVNRYRNQRQKLFEEQALKKEAHFNEAMAEQALEVVVKSKEARNREKLRISEELHDNISSRLTTINLLLESDKPLEKELLKVYLKESMKELRTVAHELANEAESGNTLKANLNALNELISESTKIKFKAHLEGLPEELDTNLEKHLFRIVMELMNNSIKHSGCTEVVLDIMQVKEELIVVFEDNGAGFDSKTLKEGFGIKSIRKRVKSINAHFTIDSNPNRGATFIIKVPIT